MLPQKLFVREKFGNDDEGYFDTERKYPALVKDDDGSDAVEVGEYKLVRSFRVRALVEEIK